MTVVVEATNPVQPSAEPRFRWRSFMRHRSGVIGFVMLLTTVVVAVFAPFIAPYDPYAPVQITIDDIFQAPSPAHLLGTDDAGKDVLSSLIYGARVSLIVGFTAAAIAIFIGALIGIVAGYQRGWIGSLLMRITDVFLVIPDLALMIVLVAILGPSLRTIILVIGILGWTGTARLVRAQTLSVRERKYVLRAKAVGANDAHVLRHHILPAVLPLMLANMVLVVSIAILEESSLAFLGLGDPTLISWGQMLNFAFERGAISAGAWWALLSPGFAIVWVVLGTTAARYGSRGRGEPAPQAASPRVSGCRRGPSRTCPFGAETDVRVGDAHQRRRQPDPPRSRPHHRVHRTSRAAARGRRRELRPPARRDARTGRGSRVAARRRRCSASCACSRPAA